MTVSPDVFARRRAKRPPATSDPDDFVRRLIDLRHAGTKWPEVARQLGKSAAALQIQARRLRDAGLWLLANGKPAKGLPARGLRGRPRNAVPSVPVSLRFAPDVADALRTVARCAGLREGEVVAEAMQRAVDRAADKQVDKTPCGLDPGARFALANGLRTDTVSVNVPRPVYEAALRLGSADTPAMTLFAAQVEALLHDLNYRLVDREYVERR